MKPKICVYAIALNEIQFVDKFMDAHQDADLVLVCDTGSTDGTAERLAQRGAIVYQIKQKPWRFDVPRNTALSLVPNDIDLCLSIDLDEFLQPGWRNAIDAAWQQHEGKIKRIAYDYIWNWKEDQVTPDVRFFADKMHHRHGFLWRHPCHETLYWVGEGQEVRATLPDVILHHRADVTKSRSQYNNLLSIATKEAPSNDRMSHYYGRELMFMGRWQDSINELQRHLDLPSAKWQEERCASMRFISRCYKNMGQPRQAVEWAIKATMEWSSTREPWLELARAAHAAQDWRTCLWAATKGLDITNRSMSYISDGACWGWELYDHAALSSFYLGAYTDALRYGHLAVEADPVQQRLQTNLAFYKEKGDT